jgi:hypothetical protein
MANFETFIDSLKILYKSDSLGEYIKKYKYNYHEKVLNEFYDDNQEKIFNVLLRKKENADIRLAIEYYFVMKSNKKPPSIKIIANILKNKTFIEALARYKSETMVHNNEQFTILKYLDIDNL